MALQTIRDQSYEDSVAPSPEPKAKRIKCKRATSPDCMDSPDYSKEEVPTVFKTKFVATPKGILPFVQNVASGVVHCGYTRMMMLDLPNERAIICMSGCESCTSQCQGRPHIGGVCECPCHILQSHYDSRYSMSSGSGQN